VLFEWDAGKAKANSRKHGVLFSAEALGVFNDASPSPLQTMKATRTNADS